MYELPNILLEKPIITWSERDKRNLFRKWNIKFPRTAMQHNINQKWEKIKSLYPKFNNWPMEKQLKWRKIWNTFTKYNKNEEFYYKWKKCWSICCQTNLGLAKENQNYIRHVAATKIQKCWRKCVKSWHYINSDDFVSLEPIKCIPFRLISDYHHVYQFNPTSLLEYFKKLGKFENPFNRQVLNNCELKRLSKLYQIYTSKKLNLVELKTEWERRGREDNENEQTSQYLEEKCMDIVDYIYDYLDQLSFECFSINPQMAQIIENNTNNINNTNNTNNTNTNINTNMPMNNINSHNTELINIGPTRQSARINNSYYNNQITHLMQNNQFSINQESNNGVAVEIKLTRHSILRPLTESFVENHLNAFTLIFRQFFNFNQEAALNTMAWILRKIDEIINDDFVCDTKEKFQFLNYIYENITNILFFIPTF